MGIRDSLFGKKSKKVAADAATAPQGGSELAAACPSVPFYASLDVSQDENLVCCVTPDNKVVAYESGSNRPEWSLAYPPASDANVVLSALSACWSFIRSQGMSPGSPRSCW
jgi:hypothetical protein